MTHIVYIAHQPLAQHAAATTHQTTWSPRNVYPPAPKDITPLQKPYLLPNLTTLTLPVSPVPFHANPALPLPPTASPASGLKTSPLVSFIYSVIAVTLPVTVLLDSSLILPIESVPIAQQLYKAVLNVPLEHNALIVTKLPAFITSLTPQLTPPYA